MRALLMVRRLIEMPAAERRLVVEAFLLVCAARSALSCMSLPAIRGSLARIVRPHRASGTQVTKWQIVRALSMAARKAPFRVTCLTEALAAEAMLRRRGHDARLQIGVVRPTGAELNAHAWVELDGEVLVGRLESLPSYAVLAARTRS
jgi:hypothetical protein